MILTVTLNPAFDLTLEVPSWEPEAVNRASRISKVIGGKGINISRVLREMGNPTTALTIIGSESIQEFQRIARGAGFTVVYINIPGEIRTNIHIVDPADGRSIKVNQPGAPLSDRDFEHFRLLYRQQLQRAKFVAVGGSIPPGRSADTYADLLEPAVRLDVTALIDAEGEALRRALVHKPLVAKPNRVELERTLGGTFRTQKQILDGAQALRAMGARHVVISDGPRAVYTVSPDGVWRFEPPRIAAKGATGAGDSLAAGILSGLSSRKSIVESVQLGIACAAATCLQEEGRLATRDDVARLLPKVKVREISS